VLERLDCRSVATPEENSGTAGLGCRPVLVQATKQELLDLVAAALKSGILSISEKPLLDWSVPQTFTVEDSR
jgi:hypothetical protein